MSVISIWLYESLNNTSLNFFMVIVCIAYASYQLYLLYFKDKSFNVTLRVIFSILGTYIMALVFFAVMLVFCAWMKIDVDTIDIFMYSLFILPSFVINIILFLIGVSILGSA
ncbi:MAG: hypothetical protein AB7U79_06635 [Candidatus Izemoplasmatales bacterium]